MEEVEGSRFAPNPGMLRRLCITQLLSAPDNLWAPLCLFSLHMLLTHMSLRGSESGGQCFQGESVACLPLRADLGTCHCPWYMSLSAHFSRWWRKGSRSFSYGCEWGCYAIWGEKEMGQLGGKKRSESAQIPWLLNSASRTLLILGGFDDLNLWSSSERGSECNQ